jgi:hypothetical protein
VVKPDELQARMAEMMNAAGTSTCYPIGFERLLRVAC